MDIPRIPPSIPPISNTPPTSNVDPQTQEIVKKWIDNAKTYADKANEIFEKFRHHEISIDEAAKELSEALNCLKGNIDSAAYYMDIPPMSSSFSDDQKRLVNELKGRIDVIADTMHFTDPGEIMQRFLLNPDTFDDTTELFANFQKLADDLSKLPMPH